MLCHFSTPLLLASVKLSFFSFFSFFFFVSLAALAAYGGSQAKGQIGAVATSLHQSHSNAGSEPLLRCHYYWGSSACSAIWTPSASFTRGELKAWCLKQDLVELSALML